MKMYICVLLLLSCGSKEAKEPPKVKQTDANEIISDKPLRLMPVNPDSVTSGNYLKRIFDYEYKDVSNGEFKSIELITELDIEKRGLSKIYKITLSDNLPEVVRKSNYLVVSNNKHEGAVFLLDTLLTVKSSQKGKSYFVAGIQNMKSKGFFILYDFFDNGFKEICNSVNFCNSGVPVYNKSDDCLNYLPHMLAVKSSYDDDVLIVNFSGSIAYYCKGLETGFGESDRAPLEKKRIDFSFLISRGEGNNYTCNFQPLNSVCNLLESNSGGNVSK